MVISDVGKLVFLVLVTLCMFALVFTGEVEFTEVDQWLTLVVGFLFGNGVNAVRKRAPSSVIVPSLEADEAATVTGPFRRYETTPEREAYERTRHTPHSDS